MSEIVLILGAGASADAGGPLMSDFISKARDFLRKNQGDEYVEDFTRVFEAIAKLQKVHSKSDLDLHNIEEIFGAFEMARMIGTFPDWSEGDIASLVESLKRVIVRTLETQIRFAIGERGGLLPTSSYRKLADVIARINSSRSRPRCSVITFNYDVALDYALRFANIPVDYGLEGNPKIGTPLLKLHGSVNWAKVQDGDGILPWDVMEYTLRKTWPRDATSPTGRLTVGSDIISGRLTQPLIATERIPVIIPPTWNKTNHYVPIASVWRRAANELASAEYIFVSGYSLTGTDTYFKYLFSLGSTSDRILQRFEVFDPGAVEDKFKRILGPAARSVFRHYQNDFLGLVETLATLTS